MKQEEREPFRFTYTAPTSAEREEIENIRKRYLPEDNRDSKLERLRVLDRAAKTPANAATITLGVIGILIFGLGLCFLLEWDNIVIGCILSAFGCVPIGTAYPVYKFFLKRGKKKYSEKILALSSELLGDKKEKS